MQEHLLISLTGPDGLLFRDNAFEHYNRRFPDRKEEAQGSDVGNYRFRTDVFLTVCQTENDVGVLCC